MQVYIRIFLAFIHICQNICIMSVINQLCLAGPADTRTHDRPARPTAFRWNQKYPRVCGEKCVLDDLDGVAVRITPAYAGKSREPRKGSRCRQDHPRVCGEKRFGTWLKCASLGSPPRMRGKEGVPGAVRPEAGITPAYAGKSLLCSSPSPVAAGSPPRMRGKASYRTH